MLWDKAWVGESVDVYRNRMFENLRSGRPGYVMHSAAFETAGIFSGLVVEVPSSLRTYDFGPVLEFARIDHTAHFGANGIVAVCDKGREFFFSPGCSTLEWAVFSAEDVMKITRIMLGSSSAGSLEVERFAAELDLAMSCAGMF